MNHITARSLPITNKKVIKILSSHNLWQGQILDLGAGEGYFSSLLAETLRDNGRSSLGEHIFACDLFPDNFKFDKIKCDFCDFNLPFPYKDNAFNAVCSIEVIEHLENIFHYAREVYRILKPGGTAIVTTPNILNINSRLRILAIGFPLLYDPLPISSNEPQDLGGHINLISYYYLVYALKKAGFKQIKLHTDRHKNSGKIILLLLYTPIKILGEIISIKFKKKHTNTYRENFDFISKLNSFRLLLGRTVIIEAIK